MAASWTARRIGLGRKWRWPHVGSCILRVQLCACTGRLPRTLLRYGTVGRTNHLNQPHRRFGKSLSRSSRRRYLSLRGQPECALSAVRMDLQPAVRLSDTVSADLESQYSTADWQRVAGFRKLSRKQHD